MDTIEIKVCDRIFLIPCAENATIRELAERAITEYCCIFPTENPLALKYIQDSEKRIISSSANYSALKMTGSLEAVLDFAEDIDFSASVEKIVTTFQAWELMLSRQVRRILVLSKVSVLSESALNLLLQIVVSMSNSSNEIVQNLLIESLDMIISTTRVLNLIPRAIFIVLTIFNTASKEDTIGLALKLVMKAHHLGYIISTKSLAHTMRKKIEKFPELKTKIVRACSYMKINLALSEYAIDETRNSQASYYLRVDFNTVTTQSSVSLNIRSRYC